MTCLHTPAWLLRGLSSIPGALRLERGVLSFVATGAGSAWPFQWRRLARVVQQPALAPPATRGASVPVFAWPAAAARAHAPWYWFGGGLIVEHAGVRLRVSFGRPAAPVEGLGEAADQVREVRLMRQRGRQWMEALEQARRV